MDGYKKCMDKKWTIGWIDAWIEQIVGWLEGKPKYEKKQMDGWMDRKNRWVVG